jgi:hypothetical protein
MWICCAAIPHAGRVKERMDKFDDATNTLGPSAAGRQNLQQLQRRDAICTEEGRDHRRDPDGEV